MTAFEAGASQVGQIGNAAVPSYCADPDEYCERQVWGIFAHTPRGQPPAAERRKRSFRPICGIERHGRELSEMDLKVGRSAERITRCRLT
jgi:hypothetical protein